MLEKKNKDFLWMKIFRKTSQRLVDFKAMNILNKVAALPTDSQIKMYNLKKRSATALDPSEIADSVEALGENRKPASADALPKEVLPGDTP